MPQYIKRDVKEYLVEVVQTVRKYVEASCQSDAEEIATEDTWHDGVVEQRIGYIERIDK